MLIGVGLIIIAGAHQVVPVIVGSVVGGVFCRFGVDLLLGVGQALYDLVVVSGGNGLYFQVGPVVAFVAAGAIVGPEERRNAVVAIEGGIGFHGLNLLVDLGLILLSEGIAVGNGLVIDSVVIPGGSHGSLQQVVGPGLAVAIFLLIQGSIVVYHIAQVAVGIHGIQEIVVHFGHGQFVVAYGDGSQHPLGQAAVEHSRHQDTNNHQADDNVKHDGPKL